MSNRAEGTFGRLRYPLGGDRPSQTARLARSRPRMHGGRLESQQFKGGIPPSAPPSPKARVRCLPPILCRNGQDPMPGYSQAPRGLSVQSRVPRVFTRLSISPGPLPRQRPSRYTFRAGRNLPDKEFRYLRTVIVTAAVHWGFGSSREALPLTFQHRAGVSPYTSPCGLAETCVFGKQSLGLFLCGPLTQLPTLPGPPLSRSYGGILPSSLARVLPRALCFSHRPPVSVCSTGSVFLARGFSRQFGFSHFGTLISLALALRQYAGGFAARLPYTLGRAKPTARCAYPSASPRRS
jgi:hypothetical protein